MKAEKKESSSDGALTLDQFQETVLQEQLTPLWMAATGQFREPRTHVEPYLWRWKGLRERMMQALELIPLGGKGAERRVLRSEEHTSELQSLRHLVCRLLLEKKN